MVSFWPWRGESSSTSEFEKTLSLLSTKIATAQVALDSTRARARKLKALSVVYLSFVYSVYVIVAFLVVGSQKMGTVEWTAVSGSPVVIYLVRRLITVFYDYRIEALSTRLNDLQKERENTIQKLKDATKYNSTLELIEKYGGDKKNGGDSSRPEASGQKNQGAPGTNDPAAKQQPPVRRTGLPPPPTANISRRSPDNTARPQLFENQTKPLVEANEEFAPNAFQSGQPYVRPPVPISKHQRSSSTVSVMETHWYDRILDVLLGEDEKDPKNRIVLLCQTCRVVNGQAPPGVKSLAEIGVWKCGTCGATNGEEDGASIIKKALEESKERASSSTPVKSEEESS